MVDEDRAIEKRRWKTMTRKEKLEHYREYYLVPTLIAAAIVFFLIYTLVQILKPADINALTVFVYDDILDEYEKDALEEKMREVLGLTSRRELITITSGHNRDQVSDIMSLQVHEAARDVDLIIGTEESFHYFAGTAYLEDLGALPEVKEWRIPEDRFVTAKGPGVQEEGDITVGLKEGTGEPAVFGVSLKGSGVWESASITGTSDLIAGVACGSQNIGNCGLFLSALFSD